MTETGSTSNRKTNQHLLNSLYLLGGAAAGYLLSRLLVPTLSPTLLNEAFSLFQQFVTIFLGIYIEALPFLLMGVVASGLVDEFLDPQFLATLQKKNRFGAVLPGALMGLAVPVCECGIVPLTRRLLYKGLSPAAGIAFLLAAPVANPIVLISTWAATGSMNFVLARALTGILIASLVGLFFSLEKNPEKFIKSHPAPEPLEAPPQVCAQNLPRSLRSRIERAMQVAAVDFFDTNRYLVFGAGLASGLQLIVPQSLLLGLGTNPLNSHLVMIILAGLLSICSTVDAFVALAFMNTFSSGSILAFLVFGPMVDIKSVALYLGTFTRRAVLYIVVLTGLLTLAAAGIIDAAGWL